jgi:hypothetical protein
MAFGPVSLNAKLDLKRLNEEKRKKWRQKYLFILSREY